MGGKKRLEPFILSGLVNIHVFDADKLSRRVLDRTWPNLAAKKAENDPKMGPQNGPKSAQNRCQKMIEILIDFKRAIVRFWGWPGGVRGALGGKTRGVKNAKDSLNLIFGDFFLHFWPRLRPN